MSSDVYRESKLKVHQMLKSKSKTFFIAWFYKRFTLGLTHAWNNMRHEKYVLLTYDKKIKHLENVLADKMLLIQNDCTLIQNKVTYISIICYSNGDDVLEYILSQCLDPSDLPREQAVSG